MYLRRIPDRLLPTFYATDASGGFIAAARKESEDDPNSWAVVTGPENREEVIATGLLLEDAVHEIELFFASSGGKHTHLTKTSETTSKTKPKK